MRRSLNQLSKEDQSTGRGVPLHRNTNLWGTNPIAHDLPYWIEQIDLSNFPNESAKGLREELAKFYMLSPDHFIAANGSAEVLDIIYKTLLNPGDSIAVPAPTDSIYRHCALANAINIEEIPLNDNFDIEAERFIESNAQLIQLCSPNNPTGNSLSPVEIEKILASGKIVVIDEAFAEFSEHSWILEIEKHPNLLICRNFSHAYGLAGINVGYGIGNPDLIKQFDQTRLPNNLNAICQVIGTMTLRNEAFVTGYVELIQEQRPLWIDLLNSFGFQTWPTDANFLLAKVPDGIDRDELVQNIEAAGLLLYKPTQTGLEHHIRVTLGTSEDFHEFEKALSKVLS